MIVTRISSFWSFSLSCFRMAPRSGWFNALRFSGRFIVMRLTNLAGSSTMITSSLMSSPMCFVVGETLTQRRGSGRFDRTEPPLVQRGVDGPGVLGRRTHAVGHIADVRPLCGEAGARSRRLVPVGPALPLGPYARRPRERGWVERNVHRIAVR